jgi:TM2 domain-containing membrane protein YozV
MSVQYDQAPQLTYAQQEAVQRAFDTRAKNATTAFLLCYFLGIFGAHRIYLGQWGAAALRLLLPLIAVGFAILGVLDALSFATFSLAVITLLCALIWEALDLGRIDREVTAVNTALLNRLLATVVPVGASLSGLSVSPAPERPAIAPEPLEPPTQPEVARAAVADAGMAGAALGAAVAFTPPVAPTPLPPPALEPVAQEPVAPEPMTFEPEPAPAPNSPAISRESAIPPSEPSTATLPPTASAYVPPVAPEIVTGGFTTEPESPPIWPGAPDDAPSATLEWPGIATTPDASTSYTPSTDEADMQTQPLAPQGQPEGSESSVAPEDTAGAFITPVAGTVSEASRTGQIPGTTPVPAEPPTQPEAPKLKHIRVRRKIMLDDGTVVGEQVLEDDFPIEVDTQDAAKILEARFQQMSLEEIARQANLPPGTDLQLKRE